MVDFNDSQLRCHVSLKDLDAIATIDQVRTIEECPSITFHDAKAVDIIYGDQPKLSVPKYKGAGQIIAVADAGFDKGSSVFVHPASQDRLIDISNKVVLLLTEKKEREDKISQWEKEQAMSHFPEGYQPVVHPLADPSGHGTHVACCAVGISSKEKADKVNTNFTNIISSPAPMAKLWFQVVDSEGGKFPLLPDLFTSYPEAKIHNNSWGTSMKGSLQQSYVNVYRPIDQAMYQNPELLIVVAAGNEGCTWTKANAASEKNIYRQIGAEGAAKNSITVGVTFNRRVMEKDHGIENYAGVLICLDDDEKARSSGVLGIVTEVAFFSNKEPTIEGRLKPDLVAPGVAIFSARSRARKWTGGENGVMVGEVEDRDYMFKTGTSHAAPMVSGSAAVLREAFISTNQLALSGALVKAMLVNGAVDLAGTKWVFQQKNKVQTLMNMPPAPNCVQGFGLINLNHSLDCLTPGSGRAMDLDMPSQGTKTSLAEPIPTGSRNLRVTLAWTDIPGAQLQDHLTLRVLGGNISKEPDPIQLLDYQFIEGGKAKPNHERVVVQNTPNNVQKITWKAIGNNIDTVKFEITARQRIPRAELLPGRFALCYAFSSY